MQNYAFLTKESFTTRISEPDFKMLFEHNPYVIEIFDILGQRVYTNRISNSQPDIPLEDYDCNIFTDKKIGSSKLQTYIRRAYLGETIIVSPEENYHEIFTWYSPGSQYEILIYPIYTHENLITYLAFLHREIQQKKQDPPEEGESDGLEILSPATFLTNVSHELRTPLSWILGFSELISTETNLDKIRESNRIIKRGGELLLTQIEKLISMSSIVKNTTEMQTSKFQISPVLLELQELIKNELVTLEKQIDLKVKCELPTDKCIITSDRSMLKQVLLNLLHNSIKFTKQGSIEVGVFMTNENEYLFYVKDTGIGIEAMKQKIIFEVFQKGKDSNFNEEFGLGLGLAISSSYVKHMGGTIWVDSEVGKGSTFCFTVKDLVEELKNNEIYDVV